MAPLFLGASRLLCRGGRCLAALVGLLMLAVLAVPLRANNLFVSSVRVVAHDPAEVENVGRQYLPGDPVTFRVSFGRIVPNPPPAPGLQAFRIELLLSTDGNPDNPDNFLLDFYDSNGAQSDVSIPFSEFDDPDLIGLWYTTTTMPMNFTGNYFAIARIFVTRGAADPVDTNNYPSVFATADARVSILPADGITVSRLSESLGGLAANELSESPFVSRDGRFVVFQTEANNLPVVAGSVLGRAQIVLRDLQFNTEALISTGAGIPGNDASRYPAMSADSRMIVYQSDATNLVSSDTNRYTDIFTFDRDTSRTTRVSVPTLSGQAVLGRQGNQVSTSPVISGNIGGLGDDAEYLVAFESAANNLVADDTNGIVDIFVANTRTGQLERVNVSASGVQANAPAYFPRLTADGRYVIFRSTATNLVPGVVTGRYQIYSKDRVTGAIGVISRAFGQLGEPVADADAHYPAVDSSGRYIAFSTSATNLVPAIASNSVRQVYRVDRDVDGNGVFDETGGVQIEMVSVNHAGTAAGNDYSIEPVLSSDGRFVGYRSLARNLQTSTITRSDGTVFETATGTSEFYEPPPLNGGVVSGHPVVGFLDLQTFGDVYIRDMGRGISDYFVTGGGTGYTFAPEVVISGGGGAGAIARAVINPVSGEVIRIDVINPGAGYTSPPSVLLVGGGGTGATAAASVGQSSQRVSVNKFGYETMGLIGEYPVPSSRGVSMSGDGRFVAVVSDSENTGGLIFGRSNKLPLDSNTKRDVFLVDRRFYGLVPVPLGSQPVLTLQVANGPITFGSGRPINVSAFDGGDVSSDGSDVAGALTSVEIYANGIRLAASAPGTPSARLSAIWTAPAIPGPVAIYAIAVDSNGNRTTSATTFVTVQAPSSLAPLVSVAAAPSTIQLGQSTTLSASAADPDDAVISVSFYANGILVNVDSSAPYSYVFTPSSPGSYLIVAVAEDESGNQVVSGEFPINVAPPPSPTISMLRPTAATTATVGQGLFFEITASTLNPGASISAVTLHSRRGSDSFALGAAARVGTTNNYRFNWVPTIQQVGVHEVYAVATDSQGVTGETAPRVTVTVANVFGSLPTVNIVSPTVPSGQTSVTASTAQTLVFLIDAADSDGVVSLVQLYANGGLLGSATAVAGQPGRYSYSVNLANLGPGAYTFVAAVVDSSGNRRQSAGVPVAVTAPPPVISITQPGDDTATGTVNQPIFLEALATSGSAASFITSVSFTAEGQIIGQATRITGTDRYRITWTPTLPGIYAINATATDSRGTSFQTPQRTITILDQLGVLPVVTFVAPAIGQGVLTLTTSSTLEIVVRALDSDGTVSSVELFVGGASVGLATPTGNPSDALFTRTTGFTGFNPGAYSLVAVARDSSGNIAASVPLTLNLTVASAPAPTNVVVEATATTFKVGQSTLLTARGIPAAGVTITGAEFFANGQSLGLIGGAAPVLTWAPAASGTYSITARLTDSAGNSVLSSPIIVLVSSNSAPTVAITSPANATATQLGSIVTIRASAGDADGLVTLVRFFANGTEIGSDAVAPYSIEWTPPSTGGFTLTAAAVDDNGALVTSVPVSVLVLGTTQRSPVNDTAAFISQTYFDITGAQPANDVALGYFARFQKGELTRGSYVVELQNQLAFYRWTQVAAAYRAVFGVWPDIETVLESFPPGATGPLFADEIADLITAWFLSPEYNADPSNPTFRSFGELTQGYTMFDPFFTRIYRNLYGTTPTTQQKLEAWTRSTTDPLVPGETTFEKLPFFLALIINKNTVNAQPYLYGLPFDVIDAYKRVGVYLAIAQAAPPAGADAWINQPITAEFVVGEVLETAAYRNRFLTLLVQPESNTIPPGGSVTFFVDAVGEQPITFQWSRNGQPLDNVPNRIIGTRGPFLQIYNLTEADGGIYTVAVSNPRVGTVVSVPATLTVGINNTRLVNISARAHASSNDATLIAGFVVSGSGSANVLLRGGGPAMRLALPGVYNPDPQLRLYAGSSAIAHNDNWSVQEDTNNNGSTTDEVAAIGEAAAAVAGGGYDIGSKDAALLVTLPPGLYSTHVSGVGSASGVAIAEVFDLGGSGSIKAVNLSARAEIRTGDEAAVIAGFVINGTAPRRILLRAIGPSLEGFVTNPLSDASLTLYNALGEVLYSNDNWATGNDPATVNATGASVGASPLSPASKDAVLLVRLPPGVYSAHANGVGGARGVVIVELFDADL